MPILNLFKFAKEQASFPAGEVIIREGEPGDVMYIIMEGEVEISHNGHIVETVGPGGIIGEMALIDDKARSATVTAKANSRLVVVDEKTLRLHGAGNTELCA